jgi:hypothetical protein
VLGCTDEAGDRRGVKLALVDLQIVGGVRSYDDELRGLHIAS